MEKSTERERELSDNLAKVSQDYQAMETELKALRKESKKRKKMMAVQQESMFKDKDFREFRKCSLCPKVFVNESFLSSHMRRRHKECNQESLTNNMSQSQPFHQTNRGELLELLQDLKSYLNLPKAKPDDFTFLTDLVKTQQEQIAQLQQTRIQDRQETRDIPDIKTDPEGSKLQAQELFWQSRIKNVEETFAKSLLESEEKLRNLQTEFEAEKQTLRKERRRERRKRRKAEMVEAEEEPEVIKSKSDGDCEPINPVSVSANSEHKSLAKTEVSEVERNDETDNISQASQEEHSELNANKIDPSKSSTINIEQTENVPIRRTVSSISLKSDHMYEAPLSFRSSKENILELIDKNPSKIDQYRSQVKTLLSDQLDQLGVDCETWKMSDEDFSRHMRQIKDYRGRLSNSSEIRVLRSQYREEVETLASQSSLKHATLKSRLSKGMSSFRKQIFRSLQNLNSSKQQHKSPLNENIKKKKSPKKKLAPPPPPPPQTLFKRVSSSETCSPKLDTQNNIYVDSPVRLPPKPAPRASKVAGFVQKCEIPSCSSSSEDEFEEHIDIGEPNIKINTILVHRNDESEDEDTFDDVENLSENKSITNHEQEEEEEIEEVEEMEEEEEEEEGRDVVDRTFDANDTDVEEEDTAADDRTFSWDSEDNENIAEIENVETQDEKVAEEIKLARPRPGSKIADLTNIIESQLYRRAARPPGGVDPLQAAMERCEDEEMEEVEVGTDISTNTLATSQWQDSRPCSVTSRPASGRLAPPQHRRTITSWDSD